MQEVEDVLYVMNSKESQKKRSEDEEGPVVESVMSQVDPMEETKETTSSVEEERQETKTIRVQQLDYHLALIQQL